ncbi:phage tail protein [Aeromonas hydrophila]|uniref:phage tail protein n=1 Tax=Aeromonas hydrophila TaxID=644 RepID=UPI00227CB050|nr:phage tail protein [Aeromonas hydrophila]WAG17119.1 phage tail protein [Aeromonas hydrophila]
MANFFAILTNQGAAKLANATALGVPLRLTTMAVGDGNGQAVTPNPSATKLVNEKRRAQLNALFADPLNASQLVAEQIIPETVGGWWIRELGLYDDTGTMIAVANCPDTYKPLLSEGSGRTQVIRMVLIVSNTSAVELKIDPAVVLATRKYVDDALKAHKESRDHPDASETDKGLTKYATQAQLAAGTDDNLSVTPKKLLFGFRVGDGYLALPSWLGGWILQIGTGTIPANQPSAVITMPITMPVETRVVFTTIGGALDNVSANRTVSNGTRNNGAFGVWIGQVANVPVGFHWLAIGR